ncbi:MAG: c-type cytochrome [candidate division KSB1 bacterium]|nr:c-type cytochrome [candidate division KSB1 bacterium]MDZ7304325.1 c-type cytochrome [candidate division KSB1 bacterium]MDZ7313601.1 c-type cytochrome [candidate division KSB1 bacterium]
MNYPVWDVAFGAGLLIAIVSILHVFVSHFAVGGGLFLVLTERKAYRENDKALLDWLKIHTKFFVLLTVVFGAISGVGIWFTIGLIHPSATSTLIHSYVWGWAIEWVFFFVEITAALLYLYGWNKLDRRTHLWLGWVYFIAAFASMVIINGIITFMLTSGKWIENHEFWVGFFNPTYFPSLFSRFAFSLALAGIYALVTASLQKNAELKGKIVKWSAWWIVPAFIVLPFFVYWYVGNISPQVWASAKGLMPTATRYANLIVIFSIATFVLSLLTLLQPRKVHFVFSLVVLAAAFTTMWSFEFIRESIRKPYIIANYMYANSLYRTPMNGDGGFNLEQINQNGVLKTAKWVQQREITEQNQIVAGKEIFRVQCQSCHTVAAYRGVKQYLQQRNWDENTIQQMLGSLDVMHNGVMPPFAGTEAEKSALAAYLATLHPVTKAPEVTMSGAVIFQKNCAMCHRADPKDLVFTQLQQMDQETIVTMLEDLTLLNPRMPNLKLTEGERVALAKWLHE